MNRVITGTIAAVVIIYSLISLYRIITTSAPDFSVYYQSAEYLMAGKNIYSPDLRLYTGLGYPPVSLLPYTPMLILPYHIAQGMFVLLSYLSIPLSLFLLMKLADPRKRIDTVEFLVWTAIITQFFPVKFTLGMGQINLLVLALVLVSVRLSEQKKIVWGGVVLSLALILKPHLILILPAYILTGYGIEIAVAAGLSMVLTVFSGVIFGWDQFVEYLSSVVPQLSRFAGREIYYNQGIQAFMARILPLPVAEWASFIVSLTVYGLAILKVRKEKVLFPAVAGFLTVLLLVEPLSWQHHAVFLLPVLYYLFTLVRISFRGMISVAVSYILAGSNIRDPSVVTGFPFQALILSHGFTGVLLAFLLFLSVDTKKDNL